MRTIRTTIDIDATTDVAWQVLTGFDAYAKWNPFMRSVGGEATVGARLTVELAPPGGRRMTIRPTVTAVEPERLLEWLGRLGLPGLFDGRHRFELEPLPDGRTRLTHGETFRGLLVPLLWRPVHGPTTSGFERFNAAFAERCREMSTIGHHPRSPAGDTTAPVPGEARATADDRHQ